jgi:26S proteasome regulatory subunit N8
VDVTNVYAVPFEEDTRDPKIWFLDHLYHEEMFAMFKKVNVKEKLVGWYSSGSKLKLNDIQINEVFKKYMPDPVLVVVDVEMISQVGLPTEAYLQVEEVNENGEIEKKFKHLSSSVGVHEMEAVGVEHLLRDIKDVTEGSLVKQITNKELSLKALITKLEEIESYLDLVMNKSYPANNQIVFNLQEILNLLPNLAGEKIVRSFSVKTNEMMQTIYTASMVRTIMALHKLLNNKIDNKALEIEAEKKEQEKIANAKVVEEKKTEDSSKKEVKK